MANAQKTVTAQLGFVDGPSVYAYARGNPQGFVDPDGQNILKILEGFSNGVRWYFGIYPKKKGGGGRSQTYDPYTGKYTKKPDIIRSPAAMDALHCTNGFADSRSTPPKYKPPNFGSIREKWAYRLGHGAGSYIRYFGGD